MGEIKSEEVLVEEGKKKLFKLFGKSKSWIYAVLLFLIGLNVWIRSLNISKLKDVTTGGYTLGPDLDPFLFLRYAKDIVAHGNLMAIDMMRYVPIGYDTSGETRLLPYMIAWLYKIISIFGNYTVEYAAVIFPVVFSVITTIFFFLFVRKIFENKGEKVSGIIGLISTAFLIVLPSLLPRTIAGIPEKESAGFGLFFAALYFFLCAWNEKNMRNSIILGAVAGVFTGLMGLVWGGWVYIFPSVAIPVFIELMIGKVNKREISVYSIWIISAMLVTLIFSRRYTVLSLLSGFHSTGLAIFVLVFLAIDLLIFKTKIKNLSIIEKLKTKIPEKVITLIFGIILLVIISSALLGASFIPSIIQGTYNDLTSPFLDRLSLTVAENKQPSFEDWRESFGPDIKGAPLFFWLFFFGSIFLFYEMIKFMKKEDRWKFSAIYIIFLFGLIFSRYSPSSILNGTNFISKIIYLGAIILFIFSTIYFYYKYHKNKEESLLREIKFNYLLLFILFFVSLIAARSAIRLIMGLAPVGAIILGYFAAVSVIEIFKKDRDEIKKIIVWVIAILVILSSIYTFYFYFSVTKANAQNYAPTAYNIQWQNAMSWVRNNTQENAVFGHWWDYGYWIQSIGNRATMLDGGNAYAYWNYLMGRHGLTAASESEALELLYSHNVTHFLIDSTEIGKYSAYSSIGSDENYDRFSWIGTFIIDDASTRETKNETMYIYLGGIALDEDLVYNNGEQEIFLPGRATGIGAIITTLDNEKQGLKQPTAVFVYQGKQYSVPVRYLWYDGYLNDFGSGYGGCIYLFPRLSQENIGIRVNDRGAAMFLSERNMRALWVKLYLLGQGERFKLVHNEPDLVVNNIRAQGQDIGDIIYYNGIRGPIKIWEIRYAGTEKINSEYLQTSFPERIKNRELSG